MATATLTLTVTDHWSDGKRIHVIGQISIGAGDYVAGGLTLNFQSDLIKSNAVPTFVTILGQTYYTGSVAEDWLFRYVNGTTIANGKVAIFTVPQTEISGAINASLVAEKIVVYAVFPKFINNTRPLF